MLLCVQALPLVQDTTRMAAHDSSRNARVRITRFTQQRFDQFRNLADARLHRTQAPVPFGQTVDLDGSGVDEAERDCRGSGAVMKKLLPNSGSH